MSKNQRKRKKAAENQAKNNSGLSPEELEMLESPAKRKKQIKKSPVIKIFKIVLNSKKIMENQLPSQLGRQAVRGLDKLHDGIHLMLIQRVNLSSKIPEC